MPSFRVSFCATGSTHTIIEAEDADHARSLFMDGDWTAVDQNWEVYEIDRIEEIE